MKKRPGITKWDRPKHIDDYPLGPGFKAGHLVGGNAGWRTFRPEVKPDVCTGCGRCCLLCPDGVIYKNGEIVDIDYDFCKGCGICAYECRVKAIDMKKENTE